MEVLMWLLLVFVVLMLTVLAIMLWRLMQANLGKNTQLASLLTEVLRDFESRLRQENTELDKNLRSELLTQLGVVQQTLAQQQHQQSQNQVQQLDRLLQQLQLLMTNNEQRMNDVRLTVEGRLRELQTDNATKLEEMRRTVDEKLHATLEQRLGESFKLVSERLEAVHKGLGEMQGLATGVGDLKRVLTNVKTRGTWGEVQLGWIIEQVMTPDQYDKNVKPIPSGSEVVEFAVRLPGQESNQQVWLPIDAKFPKEAFERLLQAEESADAEAIRQAGVVFERTVELEGKRIANKYIAPPYTTDFAILFLPSEGLYAEVLRRAGLMDKLQALRINVAGPSNLTAMLNALQMGFRTLAIEKRSSEVWKVLGTVKTEFTKFGDSLASVKKALDQASNKLTQTETRTRVMLRNLKNVEELPVEEQESLDVASLTNAQED